MSPALWASDTEKQQQQQQQYHSGKQQSGWVREKSARKMSPAHLGQRQ
jgi:hypothetical protein